MNIYLTLDYELYFGAKHGTVEGCMLQPTRELIRIGKETGARMTFFVDIGFIIKLDEHREKYPQLQSDYDKLVSQLQELTELGHDCQLHIHPHWEDSHYDGDKWVIDVSRYKLADFEVDDINRIVKEYKVALEAITNKPVRSYRAGGWCLQPFSKVHQAFVDNGLQLDSTVFGGGHFESEHYFYDFRNIPNKSRWRFEDDLCVEQEGGRFLEIPIGNQKIGPLFFWQLFLWGRLDPKNHKPIGDGFPIPTPGWRKKVLTSTSNNCVSLDGYFAKRLSKAARLQQRAGKEDLVVIGHPKACTWYSLKKLQYFIEKHNKSHKFITFNDVIESL